MLIMTDPFDITSTERDPYFNNVSILLKGDGANGSTSILDSSLSPKTMTAVGNASISTAESKFGWSSFAFDGSGDYLVGTAAQHDAYNFPGDFTIECWYYANSLIPEQRYAIAGKWEEKHFSWLFFIEQGSLSFATGSAGAYGFVHTANTTINTGTWYHTAASRSGTQLRLFLNGNLLYTATETRNLTSSDTSFLHIGVNQDGLPSNSSILFYADGYIDEFRITKGVCRYTASFTPRTLPFPNY